MKAAANTGRRLLLLRRTAMLTTTTRMVITIIRITMPDMLTECTSCLLGHCRHLKHHLLQRSDHVQRAATYHDTIVRYTER